MYANISVLFACRHGSGDDDIAGDNNIAQTALGSSDSDTFCIGLASFGSGTFDNDNAGHFLEFDWLQHE